MDGRVMDGWTCVWIDVWVDGRVDEGVREEGRITLHNRAWSDQALMILEVSTSCKIAKDPLWVLGNETGSVWWLCARGRQGCCPVPGLIGTAPRSSHPPQVLPVTPFLLESGRVGFFCPWICPVPEAQITAESYGCLRCAQTVLV